MRPILEPVLLAAVCLVIPHPLHAADPLVLVPTRSTWFLAKGTAEPSPGNLAAWRAPDFAAAGWTEAPAPFWYGEDALFGGTGTVLADMQNRYSTLYLRRRFTVTQPAALESLTLNALCDDGFIAWINGRQVVNQGGPAGTPAFNALASVNAPEPATLQPTRIEDPESFLVPGENLLAVQVFNTSLGSSDLAFDAELTAEPQPFGPPTVIRVVPPPGPVDDLREITVEFNEPVTGVRAEDFLVNGQSASGVSGLGARYTFSFERPAYGTVEIGWSTFHTITDLESPPIRFEIAAPGSTWAYELLDPEGPALDRVLPPPGLVLRSLSEVEVRFDKAVAGLDAADLQLNGVAAQSVAGFGAGPYLFRFPATAPGNARLAWAAQHGILSDTLDPRPFAGGAWEYTVDPAQAPAALVVTEVMAENFTAYRDEDQDPEDWIEIHNPTPHTVDLAGWSLSEDRDEAGQWVFPAVSLAPGAYLVVFASGKDRAPTGGQPLHTNFKLNPNGDRVALFPPELPRVAVSEVEFGPQGPDYSYGRERGTGAWRYFKGGSPGTLNGTSTILSAVEPVHFSVPRGFFSAPFGLILSCPTPGAFIRFTTNGSPPTEVEGFLYTNAIPIAANRVIRAAAFKSNALPSRVETHTYLYGLSPARLRLPALSLVTATNHLYGRNGIMEVSPRNTTKRGPAWERPVSVEYIRVEDNGGFQSDCGLRIQGGDYVRSRYNYRTSELPFSKYSFRLYFRGEYGQGRLDFPLFPETTQRSFDTVVLRAGMNDHSNPYLLDEFVRTLALDCGQPAAVGTFVHLFLNGVYKGYYNPCERIDVDFLRAYHGGGERWDIMAQAGEVREGDATAWNALRTLVNTRNPADPNVYLDIAGRLDLTNFVDYLCPLIYVDNDDWPHNNWRAARERAPGAPYRFYAWDCEWSFGFVNGHGPTWNTIQNQLSSTSPPWGSAEIQRLYIGLRRSPEFRLLFADRVHRHFFNGGALTDERIRARYQQVTNRLNGVVPGFNNRIATTWITQRRRHVLQHFERAGLLASSNAPVLSQHGGRITAGNALGMSHLAGTIYYTTNGTDPRVPFTGAVSPDARAYQSPIPLTHSLPLLARTLQGTNWSALTHAEFLVNQPLAPLQFTEIQYNPDGGSAYEFLELANLGSVPIALDGASFDGITFRFPTPTPLMPPGARWVLANTARPDAFTARYPEVTVQGWFDGNLNNDGERIELLAPDGRVLAAAEYSDTAPWPAEADGSGRSLVRIDLTGDPGDPSAWAASESPGGSPGQDESHAIQAGAILAEIAVSAGSSSDWLELHNRSATPASLAGWSLSDNADIRRYTFPADTVLAPDARLIVAFVSASDATAANPFPAADLVASFGLNRTGETLALYDPSGRRIDSVTFGTLPPGYSLGRPEGSLDWSLGEPTPKAPHEPAPLASPQDLALNEWLANPPAGQDDWIELHNRNANAPVALRGFTLSTSNATFQIGTPTFVPASGFLVLRADNSPGPDHVGLRLPAAGGRIDLLDPAGIPIDQVTYPSMAEGAAYGRIPDGTGPPVLLASTASPGASNYLAAPDGPRFSEWMARNEGSVPDPHGRASDWLELRNTSAAPYDLGGATLEIRSETTRAWTFPSGFTLPARGYRILWCDPTRPGSLTAESSPNVGHGLPGEGARLRLLSRSGQLLDQVEFGPQLPDRSVGRADSGFAIFPSPTPGAANAAPAPLASTTAVRLNEWLSAGVRQNDWIELFNPDPLPVDLAGHRLTDDPSLAGRSKGVLPPLSLLAPRGHHRWIADNRPDAGMDHLPFSLDGDGETIRLYSPDLAVIDTLDLTPQPPDKASGRFPDGADTLAAFPRSASPGAANWLPHPAVVIHEVLTHTDPPLEDAVEFHNTSAQSVVLSGWWLSDDPRRLGKHRIRDGVRISPGGYHVAFEYEFNVNGANPPDAFALSSARGGEIWLSEVDAGGQPTGYRAHASFPALANGVSYGRHRTSIGWDLAPQSRRTFGKDLPSSLAEFRQAQGLPNAYPMVGPVVVTEIHYHPIDAATPDLAEAAHHEFIEIHNSATQPVPLYDPAAPTNTWRLRGAVEFDVPPQTVLPPGGFAVIVPFPPDDLAASQSFRARFGVPAAIPLWGPFTGRLANEGEELRLERPDTPQAPPASDAGYVPYLTAERVEYLGSFPWPAEPLTLGLSLQRRRSVEYANDPANWIASDPAPGAPTRPPSIDRDFDGMPNDWELAHGLNPDNPADALEDLDQDGLGNHAEFLAGTDPRSAESLLRLALAREVSAGPVLAFHAVAHRTYTLLRRNDSVLGEWQPLAHVHAEPFDRDVALPLSRETGHPPFDREFYRLVTPALPW